MQQSRLIRGLDFDAHLLVLVQILPQVVRALLLDGLIRRAQMLHGLGPQISPGVQARPFGRTF